MDTYFLHGNDLLFVVANLLCVLFMLSLPQAPVQGLRFLWCYFLFGCYGYLFWRSINLLVSYTLNLVRVLIEVCILYYDIKFGCYGYLITHSNKLFTVTVNFIQILDLFTANY